MSLGGPLALVLKVTSRETKVKSAEYDGSENEGLIVNSDDEAVYFYSTNKLKKLYKKPFNLSF